MNQTLMDIVEFLRDTKTDGHFTLMAFTSGWKAMFKTPDLDTGEGRAEVSNRPTFPNPDSAIVDAIMELAYGEKGRK